MVKVATAYVYCSISECLDLNTTLTAGVCVNIPNHTGMKLEKISSLVPYPNNRNKHPKEQIERLAKIIKYQGWRYPVKVSRQTGYVTAGHGRIEAAKHLGLTHVPVCVQDYTDSDQEYADMVSDNAIAGWAELDLSGINEDLPDLGPIDIDLLGIEDFKVDVAELDTLVDSDSDKGSEDLTSITFRFTKEQLVSLSRAIDLAKMIGHYDDGKIEEQAMIVVCDSFVTEHEAEFT